MPKFLISEEEKKHILSLYILKEDFKTQKIKFLQQGYDEKIVDTYINDFKEIRDKKFKEASESELSGVNVPKGNDRFDIDKYRNFQELEILVDYVMSQRNFGHANFSDISVNGDSIFENDDVEIYYAPNKHSCIQYKGDKPYGWCISRNDSSNMFQRYRYGESNPTFYFVKLKKQMEKEFSNWDKKSFNGNFNNKWHFFVIQVLRDTGLLNQRYIITSAENDGDKKVTWDGILNIAPELKGLEEYFKYVPIDSEENENFKKFKNGLSDEEFAKLSYKDKEFYLDVAVDYDTPLSDFKFINCPDDLKYKYINLGLALSEKQFDSIKNNKKLLNRYVENSEKTAKTIIETNRRSLGGLNSFASINPTQYNVLSDTTKNILKEKIKTDIKSVFDRQVDMGNSVELLANRIIDGDDSMNYIYENYLPKTFYLKHFNKEDIIENENLIPYIAFTYLVTKGKNDFLEFLKYVGISFEEIFRMFNTDKQLLTKKLFSLK
jgi:hypothetical protein